MLTSSQSWKTSLCECVTSHKTLHGLCEEERTEQALPREVCPGTCLKEYGISFWLRVSVGLCHHISIFFFAYLLSTGNSQVNICISLGRQYHLAACTDRMGKTEKRSPKVPKLAVISRSYSQKLFPKFRERHCISTDCTYHAVTLHAPKIMKCQC